jgi:hypothetical protein
MTPTTLQLVQITLQALSSFAIAGGLIFTAIQFRQSRQAQVVANFSKLVELQYELRRMRVEHPEYASVNQLDVVNLGSERDIRDYYLNLMQVSLFEIAWYAHEHGQLPDDYFHSWAARMWELGKGAVVPAHAREPVDEDHARRVRAVRAGARRLAVAADRDAVR